MKRVLSLIVVLSIALVVSLSADVKTEQKNQVKFGGAMGKMMGLFGGKMAKEGVVETVVLSGNRKATTTDNTVQIIDLAEEKIYDLDLKGKSYKVTTFEEMRRRMQEAQAKAQKNEDKKGQQKEFQVDVDVKDTGQRKTINSFDCHEVIMTFTIHEKGKTATESGAMVMKADTWLTKTIPAMAQLADFDRKYIQKIMGTDAEQMATAMAMYPGLKDAMAKMQEKSASLDGTVIQVTTTVDGTPGTDQAAAQPKTDQQPKEPATQGVGGMFGGLGRRLGGKKEPASPDSGAATSASLITMNHEVMSVSTSVDASAVAIPAGFKQK